MTAKERAEFRVIRLPRWWDRTVARWLGMRGRSFALPGPLWTRPLVVLAAADRKTELRERVTLAHEAVHVKQIRRDGGLRFLWRYLTRADWRARYEAEAFAASCRALDPDQPERWAGYYGWRLATQYRLPPAMDLAVMTRMIMEALRDR